MGRVCRNGADAGRPSAVPPRHGARRERRDRRDLHVEPRVQSPSTFQISFQGMESLTSMRASCALRLLFLSSSPPGDLDSHSLQSGPTLFYFWKVLVA